jgi:hypothetical protein
LKGAKFVDELLILSPDFELPKRTDFPQRHADQQAASEFQLSLNQPIQGVGISSNN